MKIVGRLLISLAGAVVAVGVTLVGCGTTNNINSGGGTSALGETCSRTFDCKAHLACVENVCLPEIDGGTVDGGDGGTVQTGPHLGLLAESCQTSRDCQSPYECVANQCANVDYNLTATGKTCTGECNAPADCCELPVGFGQYLGTYPSVDGGTNNHFLDESSLRCEDLLAYIGGDTSACSVPLTSGQYYLGQGCAYYLQYCQCAANTWACNNNQCAYTAPCTVPAPGAATTATCPTTTRTGRSLGGTCNVAGGAAIGNGTCSAGCSADTDCDGKTPNGAAHTCSGADGGATNCTCYQSACYFACKADIDCASGSTCDGTTHLCKTTGCATNSDCVLSTHNAQAQCVMGACQIACQTDIECSPKSNPPTICSAGFCKTAGCSSDSDCVGAGSAHEFCVTAAPTAATYSSAVTN
jgi:hypothetical protein